MRVCIPVGYLWGGIFGDIFGHKNNSEQGGKNFLPQGNAWTRPNGDNECGYES
jgi:hypothetical protein